ncbi:MAG: carbohydrate-binding protein [Lachnospiraceae bacterium]|nr:carbohydrate-binding protein [Lachnospiraceae bacterium]
MRKVKKILSLMLVLCMVMTLVPVYGVSDNKAQAAAAGISNGGTYTIVSAFNGKAITQTDLSTFYANCVVWNTNALSDLAKWRLDERNEYYSVTNIVSGKSMKITGNNDGNNCDFNGYDNSNNYKWRLVPITSGEYSGCYYIVSAVKNDNGQDEYLEVTSDSNSNTNDGAQVRIWTKASGTEPRQIWRINPASADALSFTEDMNLQALNAFRNKYFVRNNNTGYDSLGGGFWGIAEVMEAMLDGYETTGRSEYRTMFEGTYNDFIARNGDFWSNNSYNDDITWAVLDSVRAYLLFGNDRYLTIARNNYDYMYNRANVRDDGLLLWEMNTSGSNSCINGPATVAACYLGIATGDESYFTKAKNIYAAQRAKLYIADGNDAGRVLDSLSNNWCSTYNQGTYLGAAVMLYEHYGDQMYYNDACNIYNYTIRALCYNNILKEENTNSGDLSGMRGILVRYIRKFIVDFNKGEFLSFFKDNARIAWMNKNSQNLFQCSWQKKTPENVTWDSFAAYNAISLFANMPTYANTLERDAYSVIEAEDMDYCKGLISENSSGTSGGRSLGGVQNNHYTAYYNVNFGSTGASRVTFRYSKAPEAQGAQGRIEIRLGSANGTLLGTAYLDNTSNWEDWREVTTDISKVTGTQNIYLVYKTDTSYVCNLDYFKFSAAEEVRYPDMIVTGIHWTPASPVAGDNIVFSADVKNIGTGAADNGIINGLSFHVDGECVAWSDTNATAIQPGQTVTLTANYGSDGDAYWNNASQGTHTVMAWINDLTRYPESDTNNNQYSTTITVNAQTPQTQPQTQPATQPGVSGGYDLVVTDIGWGDSAISAGTQVAWQVTVKNNGDAAVPAGTIIGYQVQVDGNTGNITWCDSYSGGLAPGESRVLTTNGGINGSKWSAENGTHTIMAWVDDVNRFPNEVNEGNNQYSISLTIPYAPATQAPVTQPQTQPATQPQTQPATQPQTQPETQPQTQPVTQPQTQPATQPQTQPAGTLTTVHIEAEDFASKTGAVAVGAKTYEDSQYITGFAKGDSATYNVNVADGGMCTIDIRASIKYAGTKVMNVYVDGTLAGTVDIQSTGSFATFQTFSSAPVYIGAGNHTIKLEAAGAEGYAINWMELKGSDAAPETQPQTQPATQPQTQPQGTLTTVHIEAEDFASKTGGVSIGTKTYEDSQYITGFAKNDTATYNVNVAGGGNCTIDIRASIKYAGTKTVNVYVDGNLAGTVDIQSTGSFATFQTFSSAPVYIGAGNHTIKLEAAGAAGYAINWIELKGSDAAPETQAPETQAPQTQPQGPTTTIHIEAEDYASVTGGVNVPAKQYENSQYITGFAKNDTATYNVNVSNGGSYRVDVRASIKYAGTKVMNVYVDGVLAGTVDIQSTGSFATFQTFSSAPVYIGAGNHTIKLEAAGAAGYAINWIELAGMGSSSETQPASGEEHGELEEGESWIGDDNIIEFD